MKKEEKKIVYVALSNGRFHEAQKSITSINEILNLIK
tara:strand:- start:257 stop:367 length:111 start_codon:yes stop_codon:yes gene_type:complete